MAIEITPMRVADLDEVAALEAVCYADPWSRDQFQRELETSCAFSDLCRIDGDLAGYHCYWLIAGEMQILNLAIAPEFQRRGLARRLLNHAFARCRPLALQRAYLEVRTSNAAAITLYRSCGFSEVGLRRGYYADGEDALLMMKRFQG